MRNHDQPDRPAAGAAVASSWPRMRYGGLEDLLVELTGGERRHVAGRFRNLRQLPFPDAIRTGTGNRVEYDLPRVLALCAAFEVNALLVPQSHAVAMVEAVWPELVRGMVAGAVELGILQRPSAMPSEFSAIVAILVDGFAPAGHLAATAANLTSGAASATGPARAAAGLRIDCAGLIESILPRLERSTGEPGGAALAFGDLDRSFGWSGGSVPHRSVVADLLAGSSFLDRGPYLERAAAFLSVAATLPASGEAAEPVRDRSRQAAANLLGYLLEPAPIDAWKAEIGSDEGQPRLKHLLAAVGSAAGLDRATRCPATYRSAAGATAAEEALALLHEVSRLEGEHRRAAAGSAA